LAVTALCACSGQDSDATVDAERIISLGGDLTEIVYALGAADALIARDSTSGFPDDVLALPDVGYVRALNAEGILALSPTLVIASPEAGPPEAIDQLRAAGVTVVIPPSGFSQDALMARIDVIGEALDQDDAADTLTDRLSRRIDEAAREAKRESSPKVLFLLSGRDGSPMAAGMDTAADAMIALAGGQNVFNTHAGYKAYSFEAMADAQPDVIMMMDHSLAQMGGVDAMRAHPAIGLTPAARYGRIIASDGSFLLGFGPRLPEAIEFVSDGFHGTDTP
jgi:iron complex transport system substrate-binding protein